jgi:hypothetical protein
MSRRTYSENKFNDSENNPNYFATCLSVANSVGAAYRRRLETTPEEDRCQGEINAFGFCGPDQQGCASHSTSHADDVPAMVAYNSKFGGAPNGIWINDLVPYCTMAKMPADIHIPGRVFETIAKLDFDTMMPGRAVIAILKRAALSTRINDGVVSDVRVSDITGLMSKEKKASVFYRPTM